MKKRLDIILVYLFAILALYPVARYLLVFQLELFSNDLTDKFIIARIFFSGPVLLIMGLILFFKYKKNIINRILGILFSIIGLFWIIEIVLTIIKEAA